MKRIFKAGGIVLLSLAGLLIALGVAAHLACGYKLDRMISVNVAPVALPTDPAGLARGKYLYDSRGCGECHGVDGSGKDVINAPNGFHVRAPDITRAAGSVTASYQPVDWVRTIRHGVKPDGRPVFLMPSEDFNRLTDTDVGAIAAYVQSLSPVPGSAAVVQLPLPLQALYGFGAIRDSAEKIDHSLPPAKPSPETASVEHGAYVSSTCSGCHGAGFSGGKIPGTPPDWPPAANLTSGPGSVMPTYASLDAFRSLLRTGLRPDGSKVSSIMPFNSLKNLNDTDVAALYMFLKTVPPQAKGNR